jgi:LPS export ABC transporter protein LptC
MLKKKFPMKFIYRYGVPLLMLGIVVEILVIAPQKIEKSKDISMDAEIPKVSNSTDQVMKGVHLVETQENGKDWELWSEKASNFKEDGGWIIEKVKVRVFGQNQIYYDVTGDRGQIDPKRKNILIDGNVETVTSNGYLMKMSKAQYNADEKTLKSDSEIRMYGPEIKGESRLELNGYGMLTDLKTNELQILKDIKARKVLQKGQLVTLSSESAIFNGNHYVAKFLGHVVSDYGAYHVTGQEAILEVDPHYHRVQSITIQKQVKLSDIQRWAVADKLQIVVPEKKMVLSGAPRLIQNNNELSGEEITFYESTSQIEIKKAKAKFERAIKEFRQ